MDFTCALCKAYNVSPFDALKQDKDEVILLINYYIEKGQENNRPEYDGGGYNITDKEKDKGFWAML